MIKYLIMDVDGTLTDGKIYVGPDGEAMKAFSVKDGYAINYILKPADIIPVIITARTSTIVQHRCNELGIDEVYQGKTDKLSALKEIAGVKNYGECAYFGDDVLDLRCMIPIKKMGGIVGCPQDAVKEIKAVADYVCMSKAGEGALREFAEWLVQSRTDDSVIERRIADALRYMQGLKISDTDIGNKIYVNENFFYSIQSYMTQTENNCTLESHRKYIEIQVMALGNEIMDLSDVTRLEIQEDYNEDNDTVLWKAPRRMARITLKEGDFVILYPENAHRGSVSLKESQRVVKIVGKVLS